jgi:hypothetical protein
LYAFSTCHEVRNLAPPGGGLERLELAGDKAQAAIIHDPMASAEQIVAGLALHFLLELLFEVSRQLFGDGASEHIEPVAKSALSIFERSGPIEQRAVGYFKAMALEKAGIFGEARIIPGIRKRLREIEVFPRALKGGYQCGDISFATKFRNESPTGTQRESHGCDDALGVPDPVQRSIRKDGVEGLGEGKLAGVRDFELKRRMSGTRLLNHLGGAVDARDLSTRGCDLRGKVASAAANVQDALAGFGVEQFQKSRGHFPDKRVLFIVQASIPL